LLARLGHTVHRFSLIENGVPAKLIAAAERHQWHRTPSIWTWLFSDPNALDIVSELLAPLREVDLVVGFEMTPNMIRVLSSAGVRVVDIGQDAIRFCPDLFFRIRTNDPQIARRLETWEVGDDTVRDEADRLRIVTAYDGPAAVLFVGQVDIDSSLIADAALTRVDAFVDRIEQVLSGRRLLLKPHPSAPKSNDLLTLHEHFPRARFIAGNIYALLASPTIEQIVTLSSSVAAEAPMFGKAVLRLMTPDVQALPADVVSRFHRVDARATSTAFWGDIIDGMPPFMFLDTPPPPIRQRFSVSWGYTPEMTAPVSRHVAEVEDVSFAIGGRGRDLCLFGWSEPEPWGVWSDGAVALLHFDPPEHIETFVIEIVLAPYAPDPAHPLTMTVCPRADVPRKNLSFAFQSDELSMIEIPMTATGPVELLFHFPNRISPRQLGRGDDARLLGVGLHRLTVRRRATA
jgi:hypothetical protein